MVRSAIQAWLPFAHFELPEMSHERQIICYMVLGREVACGFKSLSGYTQYWEAGRSFLIVFFGGGEARRDRMLPVILTAAATCPLHVFGAANRNTDYEPSTALWSQCFKRPANISSKTMTDQVPNVFLATKRSSVPTSNNSQNIVSPFPMPPMKNSFLFSAQKVWEWAALSPSSQPSVTVKSPGQSMFWLQPALWRFL